MELKLNSIFAGLIGESAELPGRAHSLADRASVEPEGFLQALRGTPLAISSPVDMPEIPAGNPLPDPGTELPAEWSAPTPPIPIPVPIEGKLKTARMAASAELPVERPGELTVEPPPATDVTQPPVAMARQASPTGRLNEVRATSLPDTQMPVALPKPTPTAQPEAGTPTGPQPVVTARVAAEQIARSPIPETPAAAAPAGVEPGPRHERARSGDGPAARPDVARVLLRDPAVTGLEAPRDTAERTPPAMDGGALRTAVATRSVHETAHTVTDGSRPAVTVVGEPGSATSSAELPSDIVADANLRGPGRVETPDDGRRDLIQAATQASSRVSVETLAPVERIAVPASGVWTPAPAPLQQANPATPVGIANGPAFDVDTPVTSREWGDALGARIAMLASRNIGSAELRLSPADLGPLQVQISVEDNVARVVFHSAHPVTREQLEMAIPRLREMMTEQGMTLADAGVSDRSDKHGNGSAGLQAETRDSERQAGDESADRVASSSASRPALTTDLVNTYA